MHIETEAKIKVDDLQPYRLRLEELGAVWKAKRIERDCFFDRGERHLLGQGCGLRIRMQTNHLRDTKTILCFKGPVNHNGSLKQRREIEVTVDDLVRTQLLLESLGFEPVLTFEKVRSIWHFLDCEVCLDHIVELGNFIEIEGPGEERIDQVAQKMGLNGYQHINTSYANQLTTYLEKTEGPQHRREVLLEHHGFDFDAWME